MSVIKIKTPEQYDEIKTKGLVIVDFFTEWCGPCKNFAPVFQEMAKKNTNVTFVSIDSEKIEHDDCETVSKVPSFKVFLNGELKREFSGVDKERLERYIERYSNFEIDVRVKIDGRYQTKFTSEMKKLVNFYMDENTEN